MGQGQAEPSVAAAPRRRAATLSGPDPDPGPDPGPCQCCGTLSVGSTIRSERSERTGSRKKWSSNGVRNEPSTSRYNDFRGNLHTNHRQIVVKVRT